MRNKKNEEKKQRYNSFCINGTKYRTTLTAKYKNRKKWVAPDKKSVFAFIPGTIVKVCVKQGQEVSEGDNLFILEAMKMRNNVISPITGKIKNIKIKQGDIVERQQLILVLE